MKTSRNNIDWKRLRSFFVLLLATNFFITFLPHLILRLTPQSRWSQRLAEKKWTGAGLIGTLWAAAVYFLLPPSIQGSVIVLLIGILVSVVISGAAENILQSHDDPRIVIDEWIGVWIALWGIQPRSGMQFILAVVLFRLFDVLKGPWGRAAQTWPGGWGITMDDVIAGVFANIVWRLSFAVFPHPIW